MYLSQIPFHYSIEILKVIIFAIRYFTIDVADELSQETPDFSFIKSSAHLLVSKLEVNILKTTTTKH